MRTKKIQMTFEQGKMMPGEREKLEELTVETDKGQVCLTEEGARGDVYDAVMKFLEGIREAVLEKLVEKLPSE